jgi:hypothetical protein
MKFVVTLYEKPSFQTLHNTCFVAKGERHYLAEPIRRPIHGNMFIRKETTCISVV